MDAITVSFPKKILAWSMVVVLSVAALASCGSDDSAGADGDLEIVASTSIIAALVQEVAGEDANITTIMGPGTDPHTFELTPGDVISISEADIAFINGLEYDDFLIEDVDGPEVIIVTEGIDLLEAGEHGEHDEDHDDGHDHDEDHEDEHHDEDGHDDEESDEDDDDSHDHDEDGHDEEESGEDHDDGHDHDEDHEDEDHDEDGHDADEDQEDEHEDDHDHGEHDPHVWQDPLRLKVMVDNIADALAEVDPDQADEFRENAEAYNETLDETHAEIEDLIDQIPRDERKLVTNHDAFAYFADRYGLEVIGTIIPGTSSEADPSAGEIAELTELIEHESVRAIFSEDLLDPKVAEAVASDTGVELVYGLYSEQLGEEDSGAETVHGMLLANAEKISAALK